MTYQASLFDVPPESVAAAGSDWVTELLGGSLAVSLCVIAMAILGMLMLTGRLPLRRGAQVILGCFLLLGSTALAGGLVGPEGDEAGAGPSVIVPPQIVEPPLSPANEDPYSGASLRRGGAS